MAIIKRIIIYSRKHPMISKLEAQTSISSELSRLEVPLANEELQPGIGVRFLNLKTSVYLDVADHRH
uniref:Uncharacterized protein n=1 Tax=Vespula pensylvanica TaxID=30213 RepID=A0A834U5K1_VESPE|nr:hypothetical protein H0235_011861 [Vespula pensylvanica]